VKGFTDEFYALYASRKPRLESARNILKRLAPEKLLLRHDS